MVSSQYALLKMIFTFSIKRYTYREILSTAAAIPTKKKTPPERRRMKCLSGGGYFPWKFGGRFSKNAATPSLKSSLFPDSI